MKKDDVERFKIFLGKALAIAKHIDALTPDVFPLAKSEAQRLIGYLEGGLASFEYLAQEDENNEKNN